MPLVRELKPGDSLQIGDITIVAEPKTGKAARLRIDTNLPIRHMKAGATPAASKPAPAVTAAAEAASPRPTLFKPAQPG